MKRPKANLAGGGVNADAQIRTITVGGDWIASSAAVGASAGIDGFFGNGDDQKMSGPGVNDRSDLHSGIGSVSIGGQALGSLVPGDHFGFVAEVVGGLRVGVFAGSPIILTLTAGGSNDGSMSNPLLAVGALGDFRVHEV
jgi:hypothetical protein